MWKWSIEFITASSSFICHTVVSDSFGYGFPEIGNNMLFTHYCLRWDCYSSVSLSTTNCFPNLRWAKFVLSIMLAWEVKYIFIFRRLNRRPPSVKRCRSQARSVNSWINRLSYEHIPKKFLTSVGELNTGHSVTALVCQDLTPRQDNVAKIFNMSPWSTFSISYTIIVRKCIILFIFWVNFDLPVTDF